MTVNPDLVGDDGKSRFIGVKLQNWREKWKPSRLHSFVSANVGNSYMSFLFLYITNPRKSDKRLSGVWSKCHLDFFLITARQRPGHQLLAEDLPGLLRTGPEHLAAGLPERPLPCPQMLRAMRPRALRYTCRCLRCSVP